MSSLVIRSLSVLLGAFFLYVGIMKISPMLSKDMYQENVSFNRLKRYLCFRSMFSVLWMSFLKQRFHDHSIIFFTATWVRQVHEGLSAGRDVRDQGQVVPASVWWSRSCFWLRHGRYSNWSVKSAWLATFENIRTVLSSWKSKSTSALFTEVIKITQCFVRWVNWPSLSFLKLRKFRVDSFSSWVHVVLEFCCSGGERFRKRRPATAHVAHGLQSLEG